MTFFLITAFVQTGQAQLTLSDTDFNNLVAIGEYYSRNVMLTGETAVDDLEQWRTNKLDKVVSTLQVKARTSKEILSPVYLSRPSDDDLVLWFVIREIHYNLTDKDTTPKPSEDVARKYLAEPIDKRWLIGNYYFHIQSTIAMLFNTMDMSELNFDLTSYGLENDYEKAALYFNMMDAFTTRFSVLQYMKNHHKLLEYAARLPKFNSQPYYFFKDFQYDDFEWIGHKKVEMYNHRHIGGRYTALLAHMNALAEVEDKESASSLYWNSILTAPQYFKYSKAEKELASMYKKVQGGKKAKR